MLEDEGKIRAEFIVHLTTCPDTYFRFQADHRQTTRINNATRFKHLSGVYKTMRKYKIDTYTVIERKEVLFYRVLEERKGGQDD